MGYYDCTPLPPFMPEDEENPKDDVMETHLDISVEEVRQLLADEMANMQVAMVNMQMETQKEMTAIHAQLSAVPTILWSSVGLGTYAITSSCDEYVPYTEIVSKPLLPSSDEAFDLWIKDQSGRTIEEMCYNESLPTAPLEESKFQYAMRFIKTFITTNDNMGPIIFYIICGLTILVIAL